MRKGVLHTMSYLDRTVHHHFVYVLWVLLFAQLLLFALLNVTLRATSHSLGRPASFLPASYTLCPIRNWHHTASAGSATHNMNCCCDAATKLQSPQLVFLRTLSDEFMVDLTKSFFLSKISVKTLYLIYFLY